MTRPPIPPRAVLFDWDNTLVDTWTVIHGALDQMFRTMGETPWTMAETRQRVRGSVRDSFPALFGDRWREAESIFYRVFEDTHLDVLAALPGAADLLTTMANTGAYLGVVSNKNGRLLRMEAEHLGWTDLFGRLVGATDADRDKPEADPVMMALAEAAIAPGPDVWFVGDTDIDLLCAHNTGCLPILVRPEPPGQAEFAGIEPATAVRDCGELLNMFVESHARS